MDDHPKRVECGECGKRFKDMLTLVAHIRKVHAKSQHQIAAIIRPKD